MRKLCLATLVLMTAVLIALPSAAQAVQLLQNPSFANPATGSDADYWIRSGNYVRESGWGGRTDNYMMRSPWADGAGPGEAYQEVSVLGGSSYDFSIYTMGDAEQTAYLKLAWYNDSTLLNTDELNVTIPHAWDWVNAAHPVLSVTSPGDANKVRAIFGGTNTNLTRWDDAALDGPIPEPTSLLLLGAGLVGLIAIKRRKK